MKFISKRPRFLALLLLLPSLSLFSGCVAVAAAGAGAASYAYASGALKTVLESPVPRVQAAADAALEELGFTKIESTGDKLSAKVIYRTSQDEKVAVRIETETERTSEVRIRVGTFGDEKRSIRILGEIKARL